MVHTVLKIGPAAGTIVFRLDPRTELSNSNLKKNWSQNFYILAEMSLKRCSFLTVPTLSFCLMVSTKVLGNPLKATKLSEGSFFSSGSEVFAAQETALKSYFCGSSRRVQLRGLYLRHVLISRGVKWAGELEKSVS